MYIRRHKILGSLPGFCDWIFISCYAIIINMIMDGIMDRTMEEGNHLSIAANWRKMPTKLMLPGAQEI